MKNLNQFQNNCTYFHDVNNIAMYEYKKRISLCSDANRIISFIKRHLDTLTAHDIPTFKDLLTAEHITSNVRFPGILGPNSFHIYTPEFINMSINTEKELKDYTFKLILSLMLTKDEKKFKKLKKEVINLYLLYGGFSTFVEDIRSLEFRYKKA